MSDKKYVIGFDYGTLSARICLVELKTGDIPFSSSLNYPSGVISENLNGVKLGDGWFLQDADDYKYVMKHLIDEMFSCVDIDKEDILALGCDFTNCTVVSVDELGTPMSSIDEYRTNPHSYVKLWKHHAAQKYASIMEDYLRDNNVEWFSEYGRNVSSEWFFPKLAQVYLEDREMFDKTRYYLDGTDYMVFMLTGKIVRSSAIMGVNAFYSDDRGLEDLDYLNKIFPGFGDDVRSKIEGDIAKVGSSAGIISKDMASYFGLSESTVIAVGHGDSEVACSGLGVHESGSMIMAMGTSTCYQMLYDKKVVFDGLCAVVKDGMLPGFYSYETGQPSVGDSFAWFSENLVPASYINEAKELGISVLDLLNDKAEALKIGQSGLICLDWFNGNRSVLMDYDLTSVILGSTLLTKCEEIYRSIIEATAFAARKIFDTHEEAGLTISKVYATGGLPNKSNFIMQLYADILNKTIYFPRVENSASLGAAICAAVSLTGERGGYSSFEEAQEKMVKCETFVFEPIEENVKQYEKLYRIYLELHDLFGKQTNIMHELKQIQQAMPDEDK